MAIFGLSAEGSARESQTGSSSTRLTTVTFLQQVNKIKLQISHKKNSLQNKQKNIPNNTILALNNKGRQKQQEEYT
jgi:hypothetical protein